MAINAQNLPSGEDISLDQQLSNINQSSVTSGIIYERVIPAANLYNFNTVSTFNTANYSYFKQALSEMHRASNGTKFTALANLKNTVANTTAKNEVDLAILNTQFHILNYNEEHPSQGGLTYNTSSNKFVQISGKVPFYKLHNTVIAPTKDYVSGSAVTYKIRNDLYFKNGNKKIKTLVANFGDGINRTLINNQVLTNQNISVNYTSSGNKISTYTITYADNSTLTTYGKIYYSYKANSQARNPPPSGCFTNDLLKEDFQLQADVAFPGYAAGDPTVKAKIEYRVFYADTHTDKKIRKPIIILDGFDPGDKRKIEDCDCEGIPDCAARNTTNNVFDPESHSSMVDKTEYFNEIGVKVSLINKLRTEDYDVIMVNHPTYETENIATGQMVTIDGGAYYIESNAMALVKLITETNAKLQTNGSTSEIAVVGPSMGGQISRYALSYMEKHNIPHNTYLWISVDSPHLGANIPMGDQALLYLLKEGGIDQAADFYDKQLSSPAGQQQLIEFYRPGNSYHLANQNFLNAQTTSQGMPNNRGNSYFQQHYNNQNSNGLTNSNGWPQNLRKISVVNGSLTGSKQTQTLNGAPFIPFANDGAKVFNYRGFQRVNINLPIGSITFRVHIASLESRLMPNSTSYTQISRFKKLFTNRTTKAPNINPRGVMDNVPGGYFGAQADIEDEVTSTDPVPGISYTALNNWSFGNITFENFFKTLSELVGGSEWYRHEFNPIHSFIPSFSAIAHKNPNQSWNSPLNYNLTCTSNDDTYFDSYFGLAKNTKHTSFTKESVDWLLEELAGNPQEPYFPMDQSDLIGSSSICHNINTTYSFESCKTPGAVSNWEISNHLQIVNTTGTSITVKAIGTVPYDGWIKATFNNGIEVIKPIKIGDNNNLDITGLENGIDLGGSVNISIINSNGCGVIYFTSASQGLTFDYVGPNYASLSSNGTYYGNGSIYVSVIGGNSIYKTFPINVSTPPNPPNENYISISRIPNDYNIYPFNEWKMVKAYYYGNSSDVDYWEWSIGSSNYSFPNDTSVIFLPAESSNVNVSVRACNSDGCSLYVSQIIN